MYRYIALFWNRNSPPSAEQARHVSKKIESNIPGMTCALKMADAAIYYQSSDQGVFECSQAGSLAIMGKVFTKKFEVNEIPERAVFDTTSANATCSSDGRTLVENYWGRYVAFGCNPQTRKWFAMRDPTGEIPCHMTVVNNVTVIFSSMEDCLKLQIRHFSINWPYLSSSLILPFRDNSQTGLKEVTALEAAEVVTIDKGLPVARGSHWNVVQAAVENPITDLNEAVDLARNTLLGCIGALASQHSHIQLKLSGGLDSSIVLAGLLHAPSRPDVECIHHYDSGIGADEREYARMAVAGASLISGRSCELVEHERQPHCSLEEILEFPRTAQLLYCSGYLLHRDIALNSTMCGISTRFTGMGGDAVFLRFKGNGAAIDYAWRHGIKPELLRVAFATAQSGDSLYGVLKDAFRYGVLKKPFSTNKRWGSPCEWLQADNNLPEHQPLWLQHALAEGYELPPNKLTHIKRMVFPTTILDPFEGTGNWHGVSPISAQPMVELFARIPLHLLMADAEDRTIARRAFVGLLPDALLARKVKCYLDDHAIAVTQYHREFIRSMLANGILAKEGYIDAAVADAGIRRVSPDHASQVLGIFGPQLNVEAWLRKWTDSPEILNTTAH